MVRLQVVVPSFNSVPWIEKTLLSIEQQTYQHFNVCVIDDASTLKEQREIISKFSLRNNWIKIFEPKNLGSLHSIVVGIKALKCHDDDVIIIIDGDDWLYDSHVFEKLAKVYEEQKVFLTYGNYVTYPPSFTGNPISFSDEVIEKKLYRSQPFVFTHLRTFKYILWRHLPDEELKDENRDYYRMGGDLITMWPLVEMAGKHFCSIEDILYVYNIATPLNDFKLVPDEVMAVRERLKKHTPYQTLPFCV